MTVPRVRATVLEIVRITEEVLQVAILLPEELRKDTISDLQQLFDNTIGYLEDLLLVSKADLATDA